MRWQITPEDRQYLILYTLGKTNNAFLWRDFRCGKGKNGKNVFILKYFLPFWLNVFHGYQINPCQLPFLFPCSAEPHDQLYVDKVHRKPLESKLHSHVFSQIIRSFSTMTLLLGTQIVELFRNKNMLEKHSRNLQRPIETYVFKITVTAFWTNSSLLFISGPHCPGS